ncbi:MAG: VCBS repeat-containing protein [Verrucomicrobia bacterium]|nr:VCBS repeat-containing protein [Verrucomicrobiota bacterium]
MTASACSVALAFNGDGQTDIVWQNRATGETAVWLMSLASFTTSARLTNDLGRGWNLAATADFNRDGQTDLLWRSQQSGQNEIWLMRGTNRISRHALGPGATNFSVVGTGDFNADGYADILWRDHAQDLTAVWFMTATNWSGQVGWVAKNGDTNWRASATGDCNNDGDTDIYWRNNADGNNAVWLMQGTNLVRTVEIRPERDLGFELVGTGQFNPVGNTDLLWRHTNGQNAIWRMSGTTYLSSAALPTEINRDWVVCGAGGYTNGMMVSAAADASSASLILSWKFGPTNLPTIQRRTAGEISWTTQAVDYVPFRFTNSNLNLGRRYEFKVGNQYLLAGLNAAPRESRGRTILVVENSISKALAKELDTLRSDLAGDGWALIQTNVPSHNDRVWSANTNAIASIRSFIRNAYFVDPSETKAVLLLGHVPIPYSGFHNPDGHGARALPADGFYGDVDGIYTDHAVNFSSYLEAPHESRHDNWIGDGKFDQNRFPPNANGVARLELAVGRIDFSKLPVFRPETEIALLRRYLDKVHRYRHKQLSQPERMTVGTFFPGGLNWETYAQALKNSSRLFGGEPGRVADGDPLGPENSSLWGILGGYGLPYGVCGPSWIYHESKHLTDSVKLPRVLFASVFASYCLDPDYTNNFMRALLGVPNAGLAVTWFRPVSAGNLPLSFEPLGLGEPIGSGFLRIINENPDQTAGNTYLTLLGDPTLRLQILAPPSALAARGQRRVALSWTGSPEPGVQYLVRRSTNGLNGPWQQLSSGAISDTRYTDTAPPPGPILYQVRALKLASTGSGSFTNLSQGVFVRVPK